jgi:hypothetical protein
MGLQPGIGTGCKKAVEIRGISAGNAIAFSAVTAADAVHDDQNNGFFHIGFLQNLRFSVSKILHDFGKKHNRQIFQKSLAPATNFA